MAAGHLRRLEFNLRVLGCYSILLALAIGNAAGAASLVTAFGLSVAGFPQEQANSKAIRIRDERRIGSSSASVVYGRV
ncbi:MAG: hypothetical protein ABR501_00030 [Pyrinomonadaceae bacterium]